MIVGFRRTVAVVISFVVIFSMSACSTKQSSSKPSPGPNNQELAWQHIKAACKLDKIPVEAGLFLTNEAKQELITAARLDSQFIEFVTANEFTAFTTKLQVDVQDFSNMDSLYPEVFLQQSKIKALCKVANSK